MISWTTIISSRIAHIKGKIRRPDQLSLFTCIYIHVSFPLLPHTFTTNLRFCFKHFTDVLMGLFKDLHSHQKCNGEISPLFWLKKKKKKSFLWTKQIITYKHQTKPNHAFIIITVPLKLYYKASIYKLLKIWFHVLVQKQSQPETMEFFFFFSFLLLEISSIMHLI